MIPNQFGPRDKWSLEYSVCPGRQAVGIQKYGDQIGWGPNWLGIKSGDHFSRGTGSPRIKWVWDQMRRGQNFRFWGIFLAGTLLDNRLVDLPLSYPLLVYKIQTFFIPEKNLVGKPEVVQMLRSPKSGSLF